MNANYPDPAPLTAQRKAAIVDVALRTGQARHQLGQINDAQLATLVAWARKVHARLNQQEAARVRA